MPKITFDNTSHPFFKKLKEKIEIYFTESQSEIKNYLIPGINLIHYQKINQLVKSTGVEFNGICRISLIVNSFVAHFSYNKKIRYRLVTQ